VAASDGTEFSSRIEVSNLSSAIIAARIARTLRTLHSTAAVVYRHHRKPT